MLLPWLALIAAFIGGISFANTLAAWRRKPQRSHRCSISPKQPFSLWSLILFLFFPPASISTFQHFRPQGSRHTSNYSVSIDL